MTQYSYNIVSEWLHAMQHRLQAIVSEDDSVAMIGIRTGGVDVARHLHAALNISEPLGELNISFYRDDFSTVGLHPVVGPSQVPINVEGRHIILVDDVLSTGRTVRAAMNEIFDYGRPSRITLAVLVQRTGHELPIRADIIGHSIDVPENEHVSLDAQNMTISVGQRNK